MSEHIVIRKQFRPLRQCRAIMALATMLVAGFASTLPAVQLTVAPERIGIELSFRHPISQEVMTERVVWHPKTIAERTAWPHQRLPSGRESLWTINDLLPTELNTSDPAGLVWTRVSEDGLEWQSSRQNRIRFTFTALRLEDPRSTPAMGQPGRGSLVEDDTGLDSLLESEPGAAPVSSGVTVQAGFKLNDGLLPLSQIDRMVIPFPAGWDGKVKGRYLRLHQAWKGTGTVRPLRSTFLGGSGDDQLVSADFLPDQRIAALANIADPAALAAWNPVQLANDAGPDPADSEAASWEQRAPTLFRFSQNLDQVEGVWRLPLRSATARSMVVHPDGSVSILLRTRPNSQAWLEGLTATTKLVSFAPADQADLRFGSAMLHLDSSFAIRWGVHWPGRRIGGLGLRPDGGLLAWAGSHFFAIAPDGSLSPGPSLNHRRVAGVVVSAVDGSIVSCGYYDYDTGREPYKNPFLRHHDADGRLTMALWDWTGPLIGLDQLRLESDALSVQTWFDRQGHLLVRATHDGGNAVASYVPYDLTRPHNKYGALRDISAASLGSYTSLLRIDRTSWDVTAASYIIGYHPIIDVPTSASFRDIAELGDGRLAVAAVTAYGLIETQDAWYPTWLQSRQDPERLGAVRGGNALMLFSPDLKRVLFSSVIPCDGDFQVSAQGSRMLIGATSRETVNVYGDDLAPIIIEPVQPQHGGGRDCWLMLVETAGP